MRFELIDLDAADGLAPAYSLAPGRLTGNSQIWDAFLGNSDSSVQYQNNLGYASHTFGATSSQMSWDGSVLDARTSLVGNEIGDYSSFISVRSDGSDGLSLSLSPRSLLIVRADAQVSASADPAAGCGAGPQSLGDPVCSNSGQPEATAAVEISVAYDYATSGGVGANAYATFSDSLLAKAGVLSTVESYTDEFGFTEAREVGLNVITQDTRNKTLVLTISNTSDQALATTLIFNAGLWGNGLATSVIDPTNPLPAVPEPATVQLMLLGGAALLWAGRRVGRRTQA